MSGTIGSRRDPVKQEILGTPTGSVGSTTNGRQLSHDGVKLNYRFDASGADTVLLISGLGDDLRFWDFLVPDLVAAGFGALRFDNRGVGESGCPAGPYLTSQLAEDARALIDHVGVGPVHVVGVSMGGMIAQELAILHPEHVRSAVLAVTAARLDPYAARLFTLWNDLLQLPGGYAIVLRDDWLRCLTPDWVDQHDTELLQWEAERAAAPPPMAGYRAQLAAILTHDTTRRLGHIAVPACVIAASDDTLIPPRLSETLAAQIPGAQLHTLPGGHALPTESLTPFRATILAFLNNQRNQSRSATLP